MIKNILIIAGVVLALLVIVTGIRLALLRGSIAKYRTYWQAEAARPTSPDAIVYLAMGDSTAQGIGASSPRSGYVGLVAKYLQQKTGKPVHVINISVSGAKIADVINVQLPQLIELPKADYVTIEAGANDMGNYNEGTFRQQFRDLVRGLPVGTYVSNMPSFKGGRRGSLDKNAQSASKIISELLIEQRTLKFVDLYNATRQQTTSDFGADLFHPSNKGYQNWGDAFTSRISIKPLQK